jgi:hypothetical protein
MEGMPVLVVDSFKVGLSTLRERHKLKAVVSQGDFLMLQKQL